MGREGFDLDEVWVSPGHGGVPGLGEDVLVVLGVDEHAQSQIVLRLPPPGHILPFPPVLLILLNSEHRLHIHPLHLWDGDCVCELHYVRVCVSTTHLLVVIEGGLIKQAVNPKLFHSFIHSFIHSIKPDDVLYDLKPSTLYHFIMFNEIRP